MLWTLSTLFCVLLSISRCCAAATATPFHSSNVSIIANTRGQEQNVRNLVSMAPWIFPVPSFSVSFPYSVTRYPFKKEATRITSIVSLPSKHDTIMKAKKTSKTTPFTSIPTERLAAITESQATTKTTKTINGNSRPKNFSATIPTSKSTTAKSNKPSTFIQQLTAFNSIPIAAPSFTPTIRFIKEREVRSSSSSPTRTTFSVAKTAHSMTNASTISNNSTSTKTATVMNKTTSVSVAARKWASGAFGNVSTKTATSVTTPPAFVMTFTTVFNSSQSQSLNSILSIPIRIPHNISNFRSTISSRSSANHSFSISSKETPSSPTSVLLPIEKPIQSSRNPSTNDFISSSSIAGFEHTTMEIQTISGTNKTQEVITSTKTMNTSSNWMKNEANTKSVEVANTSNISAPIPLISGKTTAKRIVDIVDVDFSTSDLANMASSPTTDQNIANFTMTTKSTESQTTNNINELTASAEGSSLKDIKTEKTAWTKQFKTDIVTSATADTSVASIDITTSMETINIISTTEFYSSTGFYEAYSTLNPCPERCPPGSINGSSWCIQQVSASYSNTIQQSASFCMRNRTTRMMSFSEMETDRELLKEYLQKTGQVNISFFLYSYPYIVINGMSYGYYSTYDTMFSQELIPVLETRDNTTAFCLIPPYCGQFQCKVSDLYNQLNNMLVLPMPKQYLQEGEQLDVACVMPSQTTLQISCDSRGRIIPPPGQRTCNIPRKFNLEDPTPRNQPIQETCSCYDEGTESCVNVSDGFKCSCKYGWNKYTCWKSPDLCWTAPGTPARCLGRGTCISKVNDYACQCNSKWGGKNCELDLSKFSWFGNTDSVAFLLPGKFLLIGTFLVDLFQMVFHFGYWFLPLNIKTDMWFLTPLIVSFILEVAMFLPIYNAVAKKWSCIGPMFEYNPSHQLHLWVITTYSVVACVGGTIAALDGKQQNTRLAEQKMFYETHGDMSIQDTCNVMIRTRFQPCLQSLNHLAWYLLIIASQDLSQNNSQAELVIPAIIIFLMWIFLAVLDIVTFYPEVVECLMIRFLPTFKMFPWPDLSPINYLSHREILSYHSGEILKENEDWPLSVKDKFYMSLERRHQTERRLTRSYLGYRLRGIDKTRCLNRIRTSFLELTFYCYGAKEQGLFLINEWSKKIQQVDNWSFEIPRTRESTTQQRAERFMAAKHTIPSTIIAENRLYARLESLYVLMGYYPIEDSYYATIFVNGIPSFEMVNESQCRHHSQHKYFAARWEKKVEFTKNEGAISVEQLATFHSSELFKEDIEPKLRDLPAARRYLENDFYDHAFYQVQKYDLMMDELEQTVEPYHMEIQKLIQKYPSDHPEIIRKQESITRAAQSLLEKLEDRLLIPQMMHGIDERAWRDERRWIAMKLPFMPCAQGDRLDFRLVKLNNAYKETGVSVYNLPESYYWF